MCVCERIRLLDEGYQRPRDGGHDDKAHPPIHPIKYTNSLSGANVAGAREEANLCRFCDSHREPGRVSRCFIRRRQASVRLCRSTFLGMLFLRRGGPANVYRNQNRVRDFSHLWYTQCIEMMLSGLFLLPRLPFVSSIALLTPFLLLASTLSLRALARLCHVA